MKASEILELVRVRDPRFLTASAPWAAVMTSTTWRPWPGAVFLLVPLAT
jgi:hypothetical protein